MAEPDASEYEYPEQTGDNRENNERKAQLLKRNKELAILNTIAGALNRSLDVEESLRETLRLVSELLGLRAGWVWLIDETGNSHVAASQDLPPYLTDARHPERMQGVCYCLDAFSHGDFHGAANINTITCSRLTQAWQAPLGASVTQGLRYHASVPLYAGAKPLGILNVASTDWRQLDPDELQFLYTIGYQVGLAIERTRLSEDARRTAARLATVEERNRLARDIHDTLMQNLAGISFYLDTVEQALPPSIEDAPASPFLSNLQRLREGVSRANELTRITMQEARHSVANLRAMAIMENSLVDALEALLTSSARASGAETDYERPDPATFPTLIPSVEDALYRIAQEALNNIQQHAAAKEIKVRLSYNKEERTLLLAINDNGEGFDTSCLDESEELACSGHFGLLGMSERARLIGATLHLESKQGKGTHLEVRLNI